MIPHLALPLSKARGALSRCAVLRSAIRSTKMAKKRVQLATLPNAEDVSKAPSTAKQPRFNKRVATILDEFSEAAWAPEFYLVPVSPNNYDQLVDEKIDFLFVESAWAGTSGQWRYNLTGSNAPSSALVDLISHCNRLGIPTVFWNKEDPPHFEDFKETSALFDVVFTTDASKVSDYLDFLPHDRVHVLPFAAQPSLHNPARNGVPYASRDVAFAGTYFKHKFEERRAQMDLLLGAAAGEADRHRFDFDIFSRHKGGDEKYQFPTPLDKWVVGSLPYSKMLVAYQAYKVFLNVNSVVDSPSMCARRIFEILACGTAVISTPSAAIRNFFPEDELPVVESSAQAALSMRGLVNSPELRERMVHKAQRRIWEEHTYEHRARKILSALNLDPVLSEKPLVSVICSTNRDRSLKKLLDHVTNQTYPNVEVHVLAHGIELDADIHHKAMQAGVTLYTHSLPATKPLGACLNKLVSEANGQIIAKFDDDDYYAPNYLRDQVNTLNWTGADLVGKASIFFHLAATNAVARRWPEKEHRWNDFVAGATFVGWAETFAAHPFRDLASGEDTQFLTDLRDSGKSIYSSDRFNYMAFRGDHSSHTWKISDQEILSYSTVETYGPGLEHVTV